MNFLQHQDDARESTRQLVLLYVLAVAFVLAAMNGLGALLWYWITGGAALPGYFVATNSAIVMLYVVGGAWLESSRLAEGGSVLAHRLGAQSPNPYDLRHRRLTNVCEELAIAAGIPVPELFVLNHGSINALAAGVDRAGAAIVVTQGALELLTRDELQGVVAHEIAHIVNGDAALSTRLAGGIYGLSSLSMLGRQMVGLLAYAGPRHKESNVGPIAIFLVLAGVVILTVGWVGSICAAAVQAGVSRQREYLADARAVEFTRSNRGLGNALRKIAGQRREQIEIAGDYAGVISHFWLSSDRVRSGWFDSHPPLVNRVRRLFGRPLPALTPQPVDVTHSEFNGATPALPPLNFGGVTALLGDTAAALVLAQEPPTARALNRRREAPKRMSEPAVSDASLAHRPPEQPPEQTPEQVLFAAVRSLDSSLSKAALLLNAIVAGPVALSDRESNSDDVLFGALMSLEEPGAQWMRVPLIEMLSGRVRDWPLECRRTLVRYCHDAVLADGRIEKAEWIYFTLVRHRLVPKERPHKGFSDVDKRKALAEVFSMAGHLSEQSARRIRDAVASAASEIGVPQPTATPEHFEFRSLTRALDVLSTLAPLRKPQLLKILAGLARSPADVAYKAFLVAVAAAIDCPPLQSTVDTLPAQKGAGQLSESQMAL